MRVIADIPHPDLKITLFSWNNKYLIKLERGMMEQTYKVSELDVTGVEDVRRLLDEEFLSGVLRRFDEMNDAFYQALARV
jgi:DNA-binding GntR family transcriptional regulator